MISGCNLRWTGQQVDLAGVQAKRHMGTVQSKQYSVVLCFRNQTNAVAVRAGFARQSAGVWSQGQESLLQSFTIY